MCFLNRLEGVDNTYTLELNIERELLSGSLVPFHFHGFRATHRFLDTQMRVKGLRRLGLKGAGLPVDVICTRWREECSDQRTTLT